MAAQYSDPTEGRPQPAGWRQWLQFIVVALLLLLVSEALWLWQTWPVRELLHPDLTISRHASSR